MVVGTYTFEEVEKVTTDVIENSDSNNLDVSVITKKVFELLSKGKTKTKKVPSKQKITKAEMLNYVLNN